MVDEREVKGERGKGGSVPRVSLCLPTRGATFSGGAKRKIG